MLSKRTQVAEHLRTADRRHATAPTPTWKRYGFAGLCVVAAVVARWMSLRWFGGAYPQVPIFLAIVATATYSGFGPTAWVAVAGLFIAWAFPQTPRPQTTGHPLAAIGLYFLFSFGIAALGGFVARARRRIYEQIHELAQQREQLSATLKSIGDAVIVTDAAGRIVSLNPVAESLTGWPTGAVQGKGLEEVFRIVNEASRETVESPVDRVLREGQIVGLDHQSLLIARDGSERPVDNSAAPIRDAEGQLAGVVLVFRDVTERRHGEQRLAAEARRKDEFLALLAHELRNPLAPIRSALDIMKVASTDAQAVQEAREVAERQLRQMTRLVDDLLDVSRIMRGKVELRREVVELWAAVERAVETARPLMDASRHELVVSLPAQPVLLDADLVRLAQVLGNLLSNAAKYTEPGGRIELRGVVEDEFVRVSVRDNGMGIAPEMLPRVFEMFMQAAPGDARAQGGLGIGLTLVKNLVEMHGGTVEAHSDGLGAGSEFVVWLPLAGRPAASNTEAPETPSATAARRIVVVDDNVDAAQSLAVLLRLRGHEVHVALGGEEALTLVRLHQPDLVFMDIGMPGMNGYQVASHLRREFESSLELVAVTGWGTEQDRQKSREAGFNQHLTKPVDLNLLETVLAGSTRATSDQGSEPMEVT